MKRSVAILGVSLAALSACTPQRQATLERADYWQRGDVSSALYMQGPKAQQQLHIDIATCTNEINEIRRLEQVRAAVPADQAEASGGRHRGGQASPRAVAHRGQHDRVVEAQPIGQRGPEPGAARGPRDRRVVRWAVVRWAVVLWVVVHGAPGGFDSRLARSTIRP